MYLLILCASLYYLTLCGSEILSPAWQQYFPSTQSWSHQSTGSYQAETLNLRPPRHRVGQGRYRLIPPTSAELNCDFPESMLMISNVVWERADIGGRDLHQIYKRAGVPHQYDVHIRPRGSTLHIFDVTPLDRGIYRCIATGMDPSTNRVVTLFQDTDFFPEQTLPLTNLIKRDYIVSASTPGVYVTTAYYRPSGSSLTPAYSTPSYPSSLSYPTPTSYSPSFSSYSPIHSQHTNPSYVTPSYSSIHPQHSNPSYVTPSSYTVDSDFIYSNGHSIKQDDMDSNKIYVYDKNEYMLDRTDHGNATDAGSVDYKS
uniref:Ig-like domain-containing protein n=1 Tax=Cacopsylla melanoneura TaxID=428564 RepID=A0A8D8XVJ5_9HEMI